MIIPPSVESMARKIAFWHGQKMIYRDRDGMQTVASSHGFGHWGDAPQRYSDKHWQEYTSAAEVILQEQISTCDTLTLTAARSATDHGKA